MSTKKLAFYTPLLYNLDIFALKGRAGEILEHYFTDNDNLKSELRTIKCTVKDVPFSFASDNGVFSKDKVDFGSLNFVISIIEHVNKHNLDILDVGCGYGFIGITLSKMLDSHADMVDVNHRAVHLAQMNSKNNKVDAYAFYSDIYSDVTKKYDLIVTNPPIRAGKEVVMSILLGSFSHLKDGGELWFVIRKDQGAKSIMKHLGESCSVTLVERCKGYYFFMAKQDTQK